MVKLKLEDYAEIEEFLKTNPEARWMFNLFGRLDIDSQFQILDYIGETMEKTQCSATEATVSVFTQVAQQMGIIR